MKAAKLTAERPAETKKEKENNASVTEAASEKRKLPWELLFLFIVMGITMVVIALKAFSII